MSAPLIILLKDDSRWPLGHLISQAVPNWPDESGNSLNELDSLRTTFVFSSGCSSSDHSMLCDFSPPTSCRTVGHWPFWHDINSSWNIEYSGGSSEYNLLSETMAGFGVHEAKEKCASLHWCLGNISASRQLLSCLSLLEYCLSVFLIQVHSCRMGFSEQNSCHIHQISSAYNINYDAADEQFALLLWLEAVMEVSWAWVSSHSSQQFVCSAAILTNGLHSPSKCWCIYVGEG